MTNDTDNHDLSQLAEQICPLRFDPRHFDRFCKLDDRLLRLCEDIATLQVPLSMPDYWLVWQSLERRLALVIRQPAHPFLRSRYSLLVLHDGLRRLYFPVNPGLHEEDPASETGHCSTCDAETPDQDEDELPLLSRSFCGAHLGETD